MTRVYAIEIAPTGYASFAAVKDKRIQREISKAIDSLAQLPDTQGKSLLAPFEGVRSLRAVRSRYRVLFRVDSASNVVSVLLVGERKPGREDDVYAVAERLLKVLGRKER